MSGIYIPGMEPPKPDEVICIYNNGEARKCPLFKQKMIEVSTAIPVPEHGDLIDRAALRESFSESIEECHKWAEEMREAGNEEMMIRAEQSFGTFVECSLRAKNAPTIIPADGKDTNVPTREEGE